MEVHLVVGSWIFMEVTLLLNLFCFKSAWESLLKVYIATYTYIHTPEKGF